MATPKFSELRELSPEELTQKEAALKRQLLELRTMISGGKLDKPHRIREIRRQVAQIETLLHAPKGLPS